MGKRDVSFDLDMPVPEWRAQVGDACTRGVPAHWAVTALNDQHAYLRFDTQTPADQHPVVGQLVGCGISHPCTTFDKWRWMPVVDDVYRVVDAVSVNF
jgi:D-serine dehydratase